MPLFSTLRGRVYEEQMKRTEQIMAGIMKATEEEKMKLLMEFALAFMHATGVADPRRIELVETRLHDSVTWHYRVRD